MGVQKEALYGSLLSYSKNLLFQKSRFKAPDQRLFVIITFKSVKGGSHCSYIYYNL